jgi:hypothetical protein
MHSLSVTFPAYDSEIPPIPFALGMLGSRTPGWRRGLSENDLRGMGAGAVLAEVGVDWTGGQVAEGLCTVTPVTISLLFETRF